MSASFLLQISLLVLSVWLLINVAAISARRALNNRTDRIRKEQHGRLRPLLMRLISEDETCNEELQSLSTRDKKTFEDLVWSMLTKVRGSSRDVLVEWLDSVGALNFQREKAQSFRPINRIRSADRLGSAGNQEDYKKILPMLNHRDMHVRIVAARALGKLGNPEAVNYLLDAIDSKRSIPLGLIVMALLHMGPGIVDPLVQSLTSRSANVRRVCAQLLGLHGAFHATRHLIAIAEGDRDAAVRAQAIEALGRIGAPSSVEPVARAAVFASIKSDRLAAANALGLLGGKRSFEVLVQLVASSDIDIARVATQALSKLGEPGENTLAAIANSDLPVRQTAKACLARSKAREERRLARASAPVIVGAK